MKLSKINKEDNTLNFEIEESTSAYVNALRRIFMNHTPVMAIEDVEIRSNSSVLYDEMLGLRLGLTPLTTDLKGYSVRENCSCAEEKEGCEKCTVKLTLEADKEGVVFAEQMKSKDEGVKPVFPKTIIAKLAEEQEIKLEATAQLGYGREHVKWSPCLSFFRKKPKDFKEEDLYSDVGHDEVEDGSFIFTIESWGQLSPEEIVERGLDELNNSLDKLKEKLDDI